MDKSTSSTWCTVGKALTKFARCKVTLLMGRDSHRLHLRGIHEKQLVERQSLYDRFYSSLTSITSMHEAKAAQLLFDMRNRAELKHKMRQVSTTSCHKRKPEHNNEQTLQRLNKSDLTHLHEMVKRHQSQMVILTEALERQTRLLREKHCNELTVHLVNAGLSEEEAQKHVSKCLWSVQVNKGPRINSRLMDELYHYFSLPNCHI